MDYNIPHGHAVRVFLRKFFLINSSFELNELNETRGKEYLRSTMNQLYNLLGGKGAKECGDIIGNLMQSIGLETDYKKLVIKTKSDINNLISSVNEQR